MHWDTFEQDNYSAVGGMGDVGSARYEPALLPPYPTIRVLSYSNCQEIHPLHFQVNFQKFSTLRVNQYVRWLKFTISQSKSHYENQPLTTQKHFYGCASYTLDA